MTIKNALDTNRWTDHTGYLNIGKSGRHSVNSIKLDQICILRLSGIYYQIDRKNQPDQIRITQLPDIWHNF